MSAPSETQARHAAMLGQLAELGLALAADLQRRALAAEDDDTAAELADSFHKVGRSVRQTLALEAKLLRDAETTARDAQAEQERTRPLRIAKRQVDVRKAVERLIWTEVEKGEEAEFCIEILADLVGHGADLEDEFLDAPLEDVVQQIKKLIFRELADYRAQEDEGDFTAEDFEPEPAFQNTG